MRLRELVGWRAASTAAGDRLFQAAEVFAANNTRMFVSVRDDRVVSWHLSVP